MAKWLGIPLDHQKVELDELQSLDLHEIVEHKARQAYEIVQRPVLVEDAGLTISALGRLPGPFVKWFLEELTLEQLCNLVPKGVSRNATAMVDFCWFNGAEIRFFDGAVDGLLAPLPRGTAGFGFDPIFIPGGSQHTYSEMTDDELAAFGVRTTKVFPQLREFFRGLDNTAK